jgi:hypothetical protein
MSPLPLSARTLLVLLALLSSFSGGAVWAQDVAALPGSRVRVWTATDEQGRPSGKPTKGQVMAWSADSLVLDLPEAQERWAVPLISISRLEVSRGQTSKLQGALKIGAIGWLIGLATGAVLHYDGDSFFPPWLNAVAEGAPFGAAGALVGALVGANRPGERWELVPLPGQVRVSPSGQRSRLSPRSKINFATCGELQETAPLSPDGACKQ